MKLKAPPLPVPADDPFKNDRLQREPVAQLLTDLFSTTETPLVMALNSPWGTGKTTFIRMRLEQLKATGFRTVYYNAWENDHSDSALVSLVSELSTGIRLLGATAETISGLKNFAAKSAGFVLAVGKRAIPGMAKHLTAGAVDLDSAMEEVAGDLTSAVAKAAIEHYEKAKEGIAAFRAELARIAASLSPSGYHQKPIIIVIDELDRCRPNFAIDVLETVKHLFAVDGIAFVISIDKAQLGNSVRTFYGGGNVEGYLRRLIDLEFTLPEPSSESFCASQAERFALSDWFSRMEDAGNRELSWVNSVIFKLSKAFQMSFRDIEHCYALLSYAARTGKTNWFPSPLIAALIVLKIGRPSLFSKFVLGQVSADDVIKEIEGSDAGYSLLHEHEGHVVEVTLIAAAADVGAGDEPSGRIARYRSLRDSTPNQSRQKEFERAGAIMRLLNDGDVRRCFGQLSKVAQRIDLLSHFKGQGA